MKTMWSRLTHALPKKQESQRASDSPQLNLVGQSAYLLASPLACIGRWRDMLSAAFAWRTQALSSLFSWKPDLLENPTPPLLTLQYSPSRSLPDRATLEQLAKLVFGNKQVWWRCSSASGQIIL